MLRQTIFLCIFSVLAGCTSQKLVPAPEVDAVQRVRSFYSAVEIAQVSLPDYASGDSIYVEEASGELKKSNLLWADTPSRAVTLALSRNLTQITNARVAPEPWPFDDQATAYVDVRVERFLATGDGNLTLSGQYFVADREGRGRDRARLFSLSAPMGGTMTVGTAAKARAELIAALALVIARDGLS